MKEITRRLYTKPVMLGMAFLLGVGLVFALFITTQSKAAGTPIPEGDDLFETTGNGETYHNFQASPIPADFFGPTSEEYKGVVPLVGVPIPGRGDDIDTIIHRNGCIATPCTVAIQMTALNLKSINPITVTYSDPTKPDESWSVRVNVSTLRASTGSMTINDGGTFDSSLKVWPKFTFTRISDGATKVLDTGGSGLASASEGSGGDSLQASASDEIVIGPAPEPTVAPAPCAIVVDEFESGATLDATSSSCPPVTLTSTNSPWQICNGKFCIPRPLTEQELLASHNASPPGTKKRILQATVSDATVSTR